MNNAMKPNLYILASFCLLSAMRLGAQERLELNDSSTVVRQTFDSPARLLEGRMSGVRTGSYNGDITSGYSVFLRGVNSAMSGSQPLWVIDGMPLADLQASFLTVEDQLSFLNSFTIEKMTVLKDLSAASAYGQYGGNGVILISTGRRLSDEGLTAEWNSGLEIVSPYSRSAASRTGVGHNHSLLLSWTKGNSLLNIAGEFKSTNGSLRRNSLDGGNFSVFYRTMVNPVLWFSTNTVCSAGRTSSPLVVGDYGAPSLTMSARFPDSRAYGGTENWLEDFDNDAVSYRVVNSSALTVNFLKELNFKAEAGVDYHNLTRYLWWGTGTPVGAENNGYASISGYSGLRLYARPSFNWNRYFGMNHVKLSAGAGIVLDRSRNNIMDGSDFLSQELRAKGLNIHSSKTVIDNSSVVCDSYSAWLSGEYSYADWVQIDFNVTPEWTPRYYDSTPTLHYGVDGRVKIWDGIMMEGGYGRASTGQAVAYNSFGNYLASFEPVDKDYSFFYEGFMRKVSEEWHAGFSLDFLDGRLGVSAKYFRRHSDEGFDIFNFGKEPAEGYLWTYGERQGVSSQMVSFTSSGVEADIDAVPVQTGDWKWTLGASFSWCGSVVTGSSAAAAGRNLGGITPVMNIVGRPLCSFVGYEVLADGSIADKTGDGKISAADRTVLGSALPPFYGAVRTGLSWRALRLDAVFDWNAGGMTADLSSQHEGFPESDALLGSSLRKSDRFRMASLSLSYDFKFKDIKFLKGLGLSLSGRNLFAWSAYGQWNTGPDCYGMYGVHGIDYGCCPSYRSVVAGIRFLFQ